MFRADLHHPDPALEKKLQRLYDLSKGKKIDMGFRRPYLELLEKFGNPHTKLPPVIHVAGTNGKGSIMAALRAILEAEGVRVHAYTSPHLCAFNERIRLAGTLISNPALASLIDEAERLNAGRDITFFEITTAMAFAAFARAPADIVLLETGLGGRLDCTNVIERPLLTVISSIGYDHMEHLGDNLCTIAAEKAGIMKRSVPCVVAAQSRKAIGEGVMRVFERRASELGSPLYRSGAEWFNDIENDRMHFVFKSVAKTVDTLLPLPALEGLHQIDNCGAALGALEVIADTFPVSEQARARGLRAIAWLARLQNITPAVRRLLPALGDGWKVWLDGAHNESAAEMLSTQARAWKEQDQKPLHLVIGMMAHKNPAAFLQPLLPWADSVSLTGIPGEPKSFTAADFQTVLGPETKIFFHDDILRAINSVTRTGPRGRILITGSLYLAGHVLKMLDRTVNTDIRDIASHAA